METDNPNLVASRGRIKTDALKKVYLGWRVNEINQAQLETLKHTKNWKKQMHFNLLCPGVRNNFVL